MDLENFGIAIAHVCNPVAVLFHAIGYLVENYTYEMEDGCAKNSRFEKHSRGKNWISTVKPNRAAPGGLDREFWKHGSGAWYQAPEGFSSGDVVEMAGDYVSGRGNRTRDRNYLFVVLVTPSYFVAYNMGSSAPTSKQVVAQFEKHFAEV